MRELYLVEKICIFSENFHLNGEYSYIKDTRHQSHGAVPLHESCPSARHCASPLPALLRWLLTAMLQSPFLSYILKNKGREQKVRKPARDFNRFHTLIQTHKPMFFSFGVVTILNSTLFESVINTF